MKTISIPAFGGPEQLRLMDMPQPRPAANDALVKLAYAGINFIDVYMRSGHYARSQTYKTPLPMTLAGSYFALGRWQELEASLKAQQWKERDYVRQALLAYAARKQNAADASATHWRDAVRLAASRPELLGSLAQMASGWNWTNETEAVLWRAVKEFPKERWPVDSLQNGYVRTRNTRKLYDLNAAVLQHQPTNAFAQNNWAALSFLLDTNLAKAHQVARQAYERNTNNPAMISTYAFSLHQQNRTAEGLKLLETLRPAVLDDPSIASCYGLLLAGSGQKEKARRYLDKAETGLLLPEELKLVTEAKKKL